MSNDPLKFNQTISTVSGMKSADQNDNQRSDSEWDFGDERIDPVEIDELDSDEVEEFDADYRFSSVILKRLE